MFVVSSLPAIVVDGSKSFSFPGCSLIRIVSSTTPGSVSPVQGLTHDKRVPYLFPTPQARSHNTKATVPLDAVPERRTERCSTRFRPGGRFWSQVSDTCRQAGRERDVAP